MKRTMQSLWRNEEGASIIIIGVMILVLIVATGVAVDMGRAQLVKNKMSAALDAAALAAASTANSENMNDVAARYFRANFPSGYMGSQMGAIAISAGPKNSVIDFSLEGSVTTVFMRIVGIDTVNLGAFSEVTRLTQNGLELAMVLDNTGSMNDSAITGGTKIEVLKNATNQMIDILYGNQERLDDVYVSLVPFNTRVNIGLTHPNWLNSGTLPFWNGTVYQRSDIYDLVDQPPVATTSNTLFTPYYYCGNAVSCDPDPPHIGAELTKKTDIKAILNSMFAGGATHTDVGTLWGWQTLSPRWAGLWGVAGVPLPYNTRTSKKALILMTDGDNTDPDSGEAPGVIQLHNTNQQLLCNTLKANGVTIYTVAFNVTSAASTSVIKGILQGCASKPSYYFDAPDGTQLINAFKQIGDNLLSLRLSR